MGAVLVQLSESGPEYVDMASRSLSDVERRYSQLEDRIIIPTNLRQRVLDLAHQGHPGIVSLKSRLRTKVWWPGIHSDAEK